MKVLRKPCTSDGVSLLEDAVAAGEADAEDAGSPGRAPGGHIPRAVASRRRRQETSADIMARGSAGSRPRRLVIQESAADGGDSGTANMSEPRVVKSESNNAW